MGAGYRKGLDPSSHRAEHLGASAHIAALPLRRDHLDIVRSHGRRARHPRRSTNIFGPVANFNCHTRRSELIENGTVPQVRSRDLMAHLCEHNRQCAHSCTTHANDMQ